MPGHVVAVARRRVALDVDPELAVHREREYGRGAAVRNVEAKARVGVGPVQPGLAASPVGELQLARRPTEVFTEQPAKERPAGYETVAIADEAEACGAGQFVAAERYWAERLQAHGQCPSKLKDVAAQAGALGIGLAAKGLPDTPLRLMTLAFAFENLRAAAQVRQVGARW